MAPEAHLLRSASILDSMESSSPTFPPEQSQPPRFSRNRKVLLAGLMLFIIGVVVTGLWIRSKDSKKPPVQKTGSSQVKKTVEANNPKSIRLIASGDTIAHDALNAQAKLPDGTYDYYQFIKPLQPYFDKAQVRFCNQAVPGAGPAFGIRGYPIFNSPLEVARDMNRLGCNVVNTGTNHTFDLGQQVIDAQLNYWDTLPNMLAVAGANRSNEEQQKVRYFTSQGVRFAFVSYSTYSNITPPNAYGLNMYSQAIAQVQLTEARQKADVVLVSMRWGTEYSPAINGQQEQIAQQLADLGADVVLGHGPHVLQPVKQLSGANGRKTLVWFSIGNFLNAQLPVQALVSGLVVLDIDIVTKSVQPPKYLPIYMHYEWTAEEKAREDLLKRRAFTMVPLDKAEDLLARSQLGTNVTAQTDYVQKLLNQFTPVTIIDSKTY